MSVPDTIIDVKNETRRNVYQLDRWVANRRSFLRELEALLAAVRGTLPSLERCRDEHARLLSDLETLCAVVCDHCFTADGQICKACGYECTKSSST